MGLQLNLLTKEDDSAGRKEAAILSARSVGPLGLSNQTAMKRERAREREQIERLGKDDGDIHIHKHEHNPLSESLVAEFNNSISNQSSVGSEACWRVITK